MILMKLYDILLKNIVTWLLPHLDIFSVGLTCFRGQVEVDLQRDLRIGTGKFAFRCSFHLLHFSLDPWCSEICQLLWLLLAC